MTFIIGDNLSKVKNHFELYVQLGDFKNIDMRYSGKYQLRVRAFVGPDENSPKEFFKIDDSKCENNDKRDSQNSDSTESTIKSNISFQEIKESNDNTYYCNPFTLEYEFQEENVNETICFYLNKSINIQNTESITKKKSLLGSASKKFSIYSLYKLDSKISSLSSSSNINSNEASSQNIEKPDQISISLSDQGLELPRTSLVEQEDEFNKMNEKELNVYLVFRLYVKKEVRQKKYYEKIRNQVYYIGNLDQLINQCFFRRFATIDFGYLYYGVWNMFISFCCTGYQSKQNDFLLTGLSSLEFRNISHSNLSIFSTSSSPSSIFSKTTSFFTQNKHNSFIDVRALKKHHSFKQKLKRSLSDDNVKGAANDDKQKLISENSIKILEKLLSNSCMLFKNIFNSVLNAINFYYTNLSNQIPSIKPEERYSVIVIKYYKILLKIMQQIDLCFGVDMARILYDPFSEPVLDRTDSLELFAIMKPKDKNDLDNMIKNLSINNNNNNVINNKYLITMLNKATNSYKNYLKKCESEQDLFSTTMQLINFINEQCCALLSYYFIEYPLQLTEFVTLRNDWLSKESIKYNSLLFTSTKSDLGNKKVNDFLNKWEKINIVDIEESNINNSKNELKGIYNIHNKNVDPFFKLVKRDKADNSVENNLNNWPVIISSQVISDSLEKSKDLEIKNIMTEKMENEIKVIDLENENDKTLENDLDATVKSLSSSYIYNDNMKYHLLVYVHGFLGNKYDLYAVRDYFERYVNNNEKNRDKMKYIHLLSKSNQDNTYLDIESESQKL